MFHVCQNKCLHVLIMGEDEDSEADLNARDDGDPPPPMDTQLTLLELSMFSLGGITSPCTMKLHGHIAELELAVMVDINQTTIDRLWFHVTSTSKFEVRLEVGSHGV